MSIHFTMFLFEKFHNINVEITKEKSHLFENDSVLKTNLKKFKQRLEPSVQIRDTSRNSPSEQKEKWKCSCSVVSNSLWPHGLQPTRLLCPRDSPGKNTGVGCHALLWGIFPTQGSNPGLPHCRQILYCLSHQGSPWIIPKPSSHFCPWKNYPQKVGDWWFRGFSTPSSPRLQSLNFSQKPKPWSSLSHPL